MEHSSTYTHNKHNLPEHDELHDALPLFTSSGLMHSSFVAINGKKITLKNSHDAIEFINCSYLGFDQHPSVIEAAKNMIDQYGVHFTCSRTRLSTQAHFTLEQGLRELFHAPAITFPSVTTAHFAVVSQLVRTRLLQGIDSKRIRRFVFDRYAHASMQKLKPYLRQFGEVVTVDHNDVMAFDKEVEIARSKNEIAVCFIDSVYSVGDLCESTLLTRYANDKNVILYIDDAHGTSIYGDSGQGYAIDQMNGIVPSNCLIAFSLAKGFGINGGGIILPDEYSENVLRKHSYEYNFSAPLDFAVVGAAIAVLELHKSSLLKERQLKNRDNVALFRRLMGYNDLPYHPIQRIYCASIEQLYQLGTYLLVNGFLVSTVFFPVVPKKEPGLRIAISSSHTKDQITNLCKLIKQFFREYKL